MYVPSWSKLSPVVIISDYCSRGCSLHWYPCRERQLRTTITSKITSRTQSFMAGLTGLLIRQKSILDGSILMDVLIGLLFLFEFLKRVMHIKGPQFAFVGRRWVGKSGRQLEIVQDWVGHLNPSWNGHDIDSCDSSVQVSNLDVFLLKKIPTFPNLPLPPHLTPHGCRLG